MESESDNTYTIRSGNGPLILSIPHAGTQLPQGFRDRLTPETRILPDTDWHLQQLYAFSNELDITVLSARYSRYVVDLNRPPDDAALYETPTTGLFPSVNFDGSPVFLPRLQPDASEKQNRFLAFWKPYHDRLGSEINRLRSLHGYVVLFDAHSIRSRVPRLFSGQLPDLNLGTFDGMSCSTDLANLIADILRSSDEHTSVVNGRFKGGFITRHYGKPNVGIHALQLEMAQHVYMKETPPFDYLPQNALRIQSVLARIFLTLLTWKPTK